MAAYDFILTIGFQTRASACDLRSMQYRMDNISKCNAVTSLQYLRLRNNNKVLVSDRRCAVHSLSVVQP